MHAHNFVRTDPTLRETIYSVRSALSKTRSTLHATLTTIVSYFFSLSFAFRQLFAVVRAQIHTHTHTRFYQDRMGTPKRPQRPKAHLALLPTENQFRAI